MLRAMSKSEPGDGTGVASTNAEPAPCASESRSVVTAVVPTTQKRDIALPLGPTEGGGVAVLRLKDDTLELGQLREARDGQPLTGELVRLEARGDGSQLYDVEVLHDARTVAKPVADVAPSAKPATDDAMPRTHKGPPLVASEAYRDGWEQVFGARRSRGDSGLN
jgi:hypothetical protein